MGLTEAARDGSGRKPRLSPDARVWGLSLVIGLAALGLLQLALRDPLGFARPFDVPWWFLAGMFTLGELAVVHIQMRKQALSASLSEIPLVLGLYFVDADGLLLAFVVGSGAALLLRRLPLRKLAFNLALFCFQASLAAYLFHAIVGAHDPVRPWGWVAVVAAVLITDIAAMLLISAAMFLAEGRTHGMPELIGLGTAASFSNAVLGLTGATILWARVPAAWLLVFPAILLLLAYRAYANQRHKREGIERLYESTRALQGSLGSESVVSALLDEARNMLNAGLAELIVFPDSPTATGSRTVLGPGDEVRVEEHRMDVMEGVWGRVASEGQGLLLVPPIRNQRLSDFFQAQGITDAIVAPLGGRDSIAGTLMVANRQSDIGAFDVSDVRMLETLAAHATMWLEKGRLLESLQEQAAANEYLARHDSLTGLHNRSYFLQLAQEAIDNARRRDEVIAVLLMDLDSFKEINDTLGHHVGDEALKEVAKRLVAALPEGATLARAGGDEFAILLTGLADVAAAERHAEAIVTAMRTPVEVADATLDVQGSVGVAVFPSHARDANGLLQRADVAMYVAKERHLGFEVYGIERDQYSPSRLAMVAELRNAIDNEELVVYYQPKVSLLTGAVEGLEALVRWDHPRKGLVPPNEFIPLAEHTGLIRPLTLFVLRRALTDLQVWRRTQPELHVAVNLSVRLLQDEDIGDEIGAILDECDVPVGSLELEITESSIMDDPVRSIGLLAKLSNMGISLSIDDFGTGYSSLSYLKRLPVDYLKIDKSFVLGMEADENDAIIVRSIIDLAHNLGLKTIAEGVETTDISIALKAMGCETAQGFGISRPLPAAKIAPWLLAHEAMRAGGGNVVPFPVVSAN